MSNIIDIKKVILICLNHGHSSRWQNNIDLGQCQ